MRMWMVDPRIMCRQHLLGEHVEIHMLAGTLRKGISVEGYLNQGLMEGASMRERHDALVQEMINRGYNHSSPLAPYPDDSRGHVDRAISKAELLSRCLECRERAKTLEDQEA